MPPSMSGYIDLHCHFVPGIDDGARTAEEGVALLQALHEAGFERTIATPHMRPGLFENTAAEISAAYDRMLPVIARSTGVPQTALSSEHYFTDEVYQRILAGSGLPYPGGRAVLLEFYEIDFLPVIEQRLYDLRRRRLTPVIAHPERYRCFWKSAARLEDLVRTGTVALLDTAALVGKYGKEPEKCARKLLKEGLYHAACSDAHRPDDVEEVLDGMKYIRKRHGEDEIERLFREGPEEILAGRAGS
jgi:protein-tyrosine phosphatase